MLNKHIVRGIFLIVLCFASVSAQIAYTDILKQLNDIEETSISEKCNKTIQMYLNGLKTMQPWALKLADATSKLQPGILELNLFELGHFDECLSIDEKVEDQTIRGKYCMGSIPLPDFMTPGGGGGGEQNETTKMAIESFKKARGGISGGFDFSLKWTVCMPDDCSAAEIQTLLSEYISNITFTEYLCQSKSTEPELNAAGIAGVSLFGTILFIMFVSTLYDTYLYIVDKEPSHSILIAFSVLTNGRKLLQTTKNPNQLLCIHGLKAISMMWVLICHGYMSAIASPVYNILGVLDWMNSKSSMFIMGGTFAVDTFFVIGGLLTVYTYLGAMDHGGKFNILMYYLHRYIRLTPVLAAAVLAHVGLLIHLGSGPFFPSVTNSVLVKDCETNWWKALIYFQNYLNDREICVPQSWYLSVDMQLFILSPLFLLPLRKYPKQTITALCVASLASMAAGFAVGWHFQLKGDLAAQRDMDETVNFFVYYYYPMHTRMAPYLFGAILGYYIYQKKQGFGKVSITKSNVFVLWLCSLALLVICVFGGHNIMTGEYNRWEHSLYLAFVRPTWAIGICWVIFACCLGYGGPINWLLSVSPLQIFSKLAYTMYIVHYSMLFMRYSMYRTPFRFTDLQMMYNFWGDFWFTTAISVVWSLMFESPMITIEKVIFGKSKKKPIVKKDSKS